MGSRFLSEWKRLDWHVHSFNLKVVNNQGFLAGVLTAGVLAGALGELSGLGGATLGGIPLVSICSSPGLDVVRSMRPPMRDLLIRITTWYQEYHRK